MNSKNKLARLAIICGLAMVVIGAIITFTTLFKIYSLAGNKCSGYACATLNHSPLITRFDIGVWSIFAGFVVAIIGTITLVYLVLKNKGQ